MNECRICKEGPQDSHSLESYCNCRGSLTFCHESCLQRWLNTKRTPDCEICGYTIKGETGVEKLTVTESPILKKAIKTVFIWVVVRLCCSISLTVTSFLTQLLLSPFVVITSISFILSAEEVCSAFEWILLAASTVELWIQRIFPVIGLTETSDRSLSEVMSSEFQSPSTLLAYVRICLCTLALLCLLQNASKSGDGTHWEFIVPNLLLSLPLSHNYGEVEYSLVVILVVSAVFLAVTFPEIKSLNYVKLYPASVISCK